MNYLNDILWVQLILVGLGATLQLVAFFTFTRDPHVHGGIAHDFHEPEDPTHAPAPHEKTALPAEPPPVKAYQPPIDHTPREAFSDLHPGQLVKTAKVAFKQHFKGLH